MTHEQGLTGGDQPRAPGESVNETAADGREEVSVVEEAKNGGSVPGKPEPPAKPSSPSTGGGSPKQRTPALRRAVRLNRCRRHNRSEHPDHRAVIPAPRLDRLLPR